MGRLRRQAEPHNTIDTTHLSGDTQRPAPPRLGGAHHQVWQMASPGSSLCHRVPKRLCDRVDLLVVLIVPFFLSFLAMPGLCCFLHVTQGPKANWQEILIVGIFCFKLTITSVTPCVTPSAGCDALCVQVLGGHPPVDRVHVAASL